MDLYTIVITFIILIFSAVVHEVAHGLMAKRFGDTTAEDAGRITLNPFPHLDPFGSILLPLIMYWTQAAAHIANPIIFGFARPVPVDFENLKPRRLGMVMVSLAGPFSNFALAIIFALILKFGHFINVLNVVSVPILFQATLINLVLGTFNLIPIPPLDGSKIVAAFAPDSWMGPLLRLEQYGFILVLLFLYMGLLDKILVPVIHLFGNIFGIQFIG